MKAIFLLLFLLPQIGISQELIENKTDEFTKSKILRTSWEPLTRTQTLYSFTQVAKINDNIYLRLKYTIPHIVFSIREDDHVMLKLANDSIIKLPYPKSQVSCRGCGVNGLSMSNHDGVDISFLIDPDLAKLLSQNLIVKIRVYTTKGYTEEDVKEKLANNLIKELKLIE